MNLVLYALHAVAGVESWTLMAGTIAIHHMLCLVHCTAGYLSCGPLDQCVVHALKGLACRARVSLWLARLPRTASSTQRSRHLRSTRAAALGL